MEFSSVSFLFFFLPGAICCYALATDRWRNLVLVGASGALTPGETAKLCPFELSAGVAPAQPG